VARFGETEAEKRLDGALLKRRGAILLVIVAIVLLVLAPEIITWLTTYRGVVLRTDTEAVAYTTRKRRVRHTKDYRLEVGTAEGEPFWIHVDKALFDRVKIGSVLAKGLLRESPEVVEYPSGPEFAALRARYPTAEP